MNSSSTIDNVLPVYGLPQANYPTSIMASYSAFKRQGLLYQL